MLKDRTKHQNFHRYGCILGMLLLFTLLVNGSRQLSLTYDEPSHLAAGYAYVARGIQGMWTIPLRGHPLLINAWEALPIFIGNPNVPLETLEGWGSSRQAYARAFMQAVGPVQAIEISGRLPAILLTMLLAAVVLRWATDLLGPYGGLIALGILCFDPTLLAHGRLATNDVGVTSFGTLSLFLTWRWRKRPTWPLALATGIALGLTLLSKSSGVLWVGTCGIIALWSTLQKPKTWTHLMLMGGLAIFTVWTMYGFAVGPIKNLPPLPIPAPLHWESILFQTQQAAQRPFYALGILESGRRWWYFPLAFLIKNPLPLLIALAVALSMSLRRSLRSTTIWPLFSLIYLLAAIIEGPNIGYRHLFPIHPYFYLLIAATSLQLRKTPTSPHKLKDHVCRPYIFAGMVMLGLWYIGGTLRIYPHEIAFFNELTGGPDHGWSYLSDSNTDWMQGLKALKAWQDATQITFAYSGPDGYVGLDRYDLDYIPLPSTRNNPEPLFSPAFYPPPGDYVISAHTLNGLGLIDPDNYAWFRYHQPDAVIAHVLFYYHVTPPTTSTWLAQCQHPTPPLPSEAIAQEFGENSPRQITFDCTQSWIYPAGIPNLGWYALHGQALSAKHIFERLRPALPQAKDPFTARHLANLTLGYRRYTYQRLPAFALYEWTYEKSPLPDQIVHYSAPATTPPQTLNTSSQAEAPQALDGPLTYLGITLDESQDTLEISTWWQVTEGGINRPLSLMAHLIKQTGETITVADGLGISPTYWKTGDIIVQRHTFSRPITGSWLRTGAYWLDDGNRWTIPGYPGADALFIPLEIGK